MTPHARNLSSLSRRARREWEQDERQDRSAAFAASIIEARRNARKCLVGLGVALGAIGRMCADYAPRCCEDGCDDCGWSGRREWVPTLNDALAVLDVTDEEWAAMKGAM